MLAVFATGHLQAWLKARPAEDLVGRLLQSDSPLHCVVSLCCLRSKQAIGPEAGGEASEFH